MANDYHNQHPASIPGLPALPAPLQTSSPDTDPNQQPPQLDDLPDALASATAKIAALCENVASDNLQLNRQLVTYCQQATQAFDALKNIANCTTIPEALLILIQAIARVVNSRFAFYNGRFTSQLQAPLADPEKNTSIFADPEILPLARQFFNKNLTSFQKFFADPEPFQTTLIGYDDPSLATGGGCVLSIPLVSRDPNVQNIGTLLFVRVDNQPPFDPIDVSLAMSLADTASAVVRSFLYAQKIPEAFLQTIISLVRAVEAKDAYTSGHSTRVAELACQLGRHIGIDEPQIQLLHWAGLMHDVGKIGIRDNVLQKPGKLTPQEFAHIKTHPVKSCKVLEPIKALTPVLDAVRHHHEHWNGQGYPAGLAGNDIPLLARILQVADVWDALTSTRSYRNAMSKPEALTVIRDMAGSTLDPQLAQHFADMIDNPKSPPNLD